MIWPVPNSKTSMQNDEQLPTDVTRGGHGETVEHLVAGCRVLANSEYLTRHNRALMILAVAWAKEYKLIGEDTVWY